MTEDQLLEEIKQHVIYVRMIPFCIEHAERDNPTALKALSTHPVVNVRARVARNVATPPEVLQRMVEEDQGDVVELARETLELQRTGKRRRWNHLPKKKSPTRQRRARSTGGTSNAKQR